MISTHLKRVIATILSGSFESLLIANGQFIPDSKKYFVKILTVYWTILAYVASPLPGFCVRLPSLYPVPCLP